MWKRVTLLWSLVRGYARRLWFALRHPAAPGWLKIGTALIVLYVVSPIDLVPDVLPVIGVVDDLIVTPDKSVSYAIIGAGGFLGMGKHDVAVPVGQFKEDKGRIVLAGATKDALKAAPKVEYAK